LSIIYDALKKVEESTVNPGEKSNTPDNKNPRKLKIYFLYAFIISLGLFLANQVFNYVTRSQTIAPGLKKTDIKKPAGQNNLPKETLEKSTPAAPIDNAENVNETENISFVLNGVFFSENNGYALINNQIIKQGDKISGATVKRIGTDNVELDLGGKIIKLSTRAR
jgi:hypothetical protein